MGMKRRKVAGEGRERAPDEKVLLFPGHKQAHWLCYAVG